MHGTHDIVITAGQTSCGFILKRDEKGKKLWRVSTADLVPRSFPPGKPSMATVPGVIALTEEQYDFSYGIGETEYSTGKGYYFGDGADPSFDGRIRLSPQRIHEARPSIANPSFETGTVGQPPPDWTVVAGTPTVESSGFLPPAHGTRFCKLDTNEVIEQSLSTTGLVAGQPFNFSAAIGLAIGRSVVVTIDCGSASRSITVTNSGTQEAWITRTFSFVIPSGFNKLVIRFSYAQAGFAMVDDIKYLTPRKITSSTTYGLFLVRGWNIERWHETNGWDFFVRTTADVTDMEVWGNYILIGRGTGNNFIAVDISTGSVSEASVPAVQFGLAGGLVWRSLGGILYYATNPLQSWALVGQCGGSINHIINHPSRIFVCAEDGMYEATTSKMWYYDPLIASYASSSFGVNAGAWQHLLFIPCVGNALLAIHPDASIVSIAPNIKAPDVADYYFSIRALAADDRYIYVIGQKDTAIWLFKGRLTDDNEILWYPISSFTMSSGSVYDACVSHGSVSRLWIAGDAGMTFFRLPAFNTAPQADASYRFQTGGSLVTPWYDMGYSIWDKMFHTLSCEAENVSQSGNTIGVQYQADGGQWSSVGTITTTISVIPLSISAKKVRFKFTLNGQATSSPVLVKAMVSARLARIVRQFEFAVDLNERVKLNNVPETIEQDAAALADFLWQTAMGSPSVALSNIYGGSCNVTVVSIDEAWDSMPVDGSAGRYAVIKAVEII